MNIMDRNKMATGDSAKSYKLVALKTAKDDIPGGSIIYGISFCTKFLTGHEQFSDNKNN